MISITVFITILFIITTIHNYDVALENFIVKKVKSKSEISTKIIDLISYDLPEPVKLEIEK